MTNERLLLWLAWCPILVIFAVTIWSFQAPGHDPTYSPRRVVGLNLPKRERDYSYDDLDWLARNVYFEARGQSDEGQAAVAYVTINRAFNSKDFPSTIKDVVLEKNHACQFSWTCEKGGPNRSMDDRVALQRAWRIAKMALEGTIENPVGDSLYYHSVKVGPFKFLPHTFRLQIEDHIFYVTDINDPNIKLRVCKS